MGFTRDLGSRGSAVLRWSDFNGACHESAVGDLCSHGVPCGMPLVVVLSETDDVSKLSAAPRDPGECVVILAAAGNFVAKPPGLDGPVDRPDTGSDHSPATAADNFWFRPGSRVSAVARGQRPGHDARDSIGETGVQ